MLAASHLALHSGDSALAVWPSFRGRGGSPFEGWLLEASTFAALSQPLRAQAALDSATARAGEDSVSRTRVRQVRILIERATGH